MGPIAFGAVMLAVLLVVVAGFVWQAARRSPVHDVSAYIVPEAADFIFARLSDGALGRLAVADVRRVLEWNLHFSQVVAARNGGTVVGSGDGLEYVLERAAESTVEIDPVDVAEILVLEPEYLLSIGAVGPPVETEAS